MRTVYDPFDGKNVQISDRLTDRLRGKYAMGPHLPNGNPEFGWKQFQSPPIQYEAAKRIELLESLLVRAQDLIRNCHEVAVTKGQETHWDILEKCLREFHDELNTVNLGE